MVKKIGFIFLLVLLASQSALACHCKKFSIYAQNNTSYSLGLTINGMNTAKIELSSPEVQAYTGLQRVGAGSIGSDAVMAIDGILMTPQAIASKWPLFTYSVNDNDMKLNVQNSDVNGNNHKYHFEIVPYPDGESEYSVLIRVSEK